MEAHCAASCAAWRRQTATEEPTDDASATGVTLVPTDSDAFHTQESCTQYNALKLNQELFTRAPSSALADAFERKLLNGESCASGCLVARAVGVAICARPV